MANPVDIEHDTAKQRLTITWDDGERSVLSQSYLRGWCPCAGCQGHGNRVHFRPSEGAALSIVGIEEVGAYALALRFADGHDSGIYRWSWLRTIAANGEPRGFKYGHFEGGVYVRSDKDRLHDEAPTVPGGPGN